MPASLLCVQFRNLLPSEDILLFARALWTQHERSFHADATLRITRVEPRILSGRERDAEMRFEALLAHGAQQGVATGGEPLATIAAAFANLRTVPARVAQSRVTPSFSTS